MTEVQNGSAVQMNFTGTLDDNSIFDQTKKGQPLHFTVGEENVIRGLSEGLIGMKVGEKKTLRVRPEDAYGLNNENLLKTVVRSSLPKEIQVGTYLAGPDGLKWRAKEVGEEEVVLDGNHPLAGQALTFFIELVAVEES